MRCILTGVNTCVGCGCSVETLCELFYQRGADDARKAIVKGVASRFPRDIEIMSFINRKEDGGP